MGKKKTRKQVRKWAQDHIPDQLERYGDDLLNWLQPVRQQRRQIAAVVWGPVLLAGLLFLVWQVIRVWRGVPIMGDLAEEQDPEPGTAQ
jgi:hypothetical protein